MKNILYLTLLLGSFLAACQDEPTFPDPGFDLTQDVRDTVRRDTIDTYYFEMQVKAPNGVDFVQILDGYTYKEVERLQQYHGQTNFLLRYPVDLTAITDRDTTISYVLKIVDRDMRSYNKAFSLTVKRFSAPAITVSGVKGTIGLVSPVFELKALFETGLNTMKRYKVTFENTTIDEGMLGDTLSEYQYSYICQLSMQKEQDYSLCIELEDNKGTVAKEKMTLRLIEMKRPIKVIINALNTSNVLKLNREWELHYNPQKPEQLDSISGLLYSIYIINGVETLIVNKFSYRFSYTDLGMVHSIRHITHNSDDEWTYLYDDQQRLTEVNNRVSYKNDLRFDDWYTDKTPGAFAFLSDWPSTEKLFYRTSPTGEKVLAEAWLVLNTRTLITRMSPIQLPTYLKQLPPFIPFNRGAVSQEDLVSLLMTPFGTETIHKYNAAYKDDYDKYSKINPNLEYSYITNTTGRLDKIVKKEVNLTTGVRKIKREYIFIYK